MINENTRQLRLHRPRHARQNEATPMVVAVVTIIASDGRREIVPDWLTEPHTADLYNKLYWSPLLRAIVENRKPSEEKS